LRKIEPFLAGLLAEDKFDLLLTPELNEERPQIRVKVDGVVVGALDTKGNHHVAPPALTSSIGVKWVSAKRHP